MVFSIPFLVVEQGLKSPCPAQPWALGWGEGNLGKEEAKAGRARGWSGYLGLGQPLADLTGLTKSLLPKGLKARYPELNVRPPKDLKVRSSEDLKVRFSKDFEEEEEEEEKGKKEEEKQ